MPNIQLAKNLRTLRKAHHLTQTQLSEILNISRQAYSNYENSKRTPDLDSLIHLSQLYHVTLDQLVNYNIGSKTKKGSIPAQAAINATNKHTLYLDDTETDLIMKFRDLSINSQKILIGFLDSQVALH
ncbi:MAG: helix-turn-helix transcriptional regulator [Bariatricus sp.]|nr:helix-turn-helix transcriptional regulator [Bariatricus sp.]